jgi:hypothetical protein
MRNIASLGLLTIELVASHIGTWAEGGGGGGGGEEAMEAVDGTMACVSEGVEWRDRGASR